MISRAALVLLSILVPSMAWASTLHRGLGPSPDALDIHLAQGLSAFNLLRDLHEGLLTRDAQGRVVAGIARRWSVSEDRRVWRFELRPEARWSDGTRIKAADFVRGFERAQAADTASPTTAWLEPVSGIRVVDEATLEIRLDRPVPWFSELLTLPVTFPWPGDDQVRYSGAFMLDREVPGSRYELVPNPHFHGHDSVRLARVIWHVTEDPGAELSRFRASELHVTETVPPGRIDWLAGEMGESLRIAPYLGSFYLVYNLSQAPLAEDRALRKALSLAIDREILVERVLGSGELPAWRLVPPGLEGWPDELPEHASLGQPSRLEHARAMLAESGFDAPGRTLELRFNSSLAHRRLAVAIAAMWKQNLGITTRLVNEEWKVFVTNRRQGRITEIVRGGWIADWAEAGNFLGNFYSASPLNYAFFNDPHFDTLLERAAGRHGGRRLELLWQAEQRLLDEHAIIPLYYYVSRHLVSPGVRGWQDNAMDIHLSRWLALEHD